MILTVLLLTAWSAAGNAPVRVSGRVTDTSGAPLPYASVTVKGRMIGTVAEKDGAFALTLPDAGEYTLTASCLGHETHETRVAGGGTVDFRLPVSATGINTVVVTATRTPKLLKDAPDVLGRDHARKHRHVL